MSELSATQDQGSTGQLPSASRMGHIREFADADIPGVARLHEVVFKQDVRTAPAGLDPYRAYFTQVFLENPSRDASLPSLVYEDDDGRIVGFMGVVPRRMSMNGRQFQAAISSQFVVDPTGPACQRDSDRGGP